MTGASATHAHTGRTFLGLGMRRWRLVSGAAMFAYISTHMLNHAAGLWSLALAEDLLDLAMGLWRHPVGGALLYGAAAVHFSLALVTIYERRHWKLSAVEWLRLWAGFSLPWLLIGHVYSTRIASDWYAATASYENIVGSLVRGGLQGWQIALLAPGWLHGCLGLWISLRRYETMRRLQPMLLALMIGLPILSAAGFGAMARAVIAAPASARSPAEAAQKASLESWRQATVAAYIALLVAAAGAGLWRNARERRGR